MDGKDFWKEFAIPFGLLILFVIAYFGVYGLSKSYTKPVTIDLISGSEIVTNQSEVPVTGVLHNSKNLVVNGKSVVVGDDGAFSTTVPVNVGVNNVDISSGSAKQTVKITREDVKPAITATATSVTPGGTDLTTSGPVETITGSFGLAALIVSAYIYRKSMRQKTLQKA